MINSMTGYGDAACQVEATSYAVEIKTVNNRYYKANIKLPETMAFLEEAIDKLLRASLSRGTVTYILRIKDNSLKPSFQINEVVMEKCIETLRGIADSSKINYDINLANLLLLPGVIQPAEPCQEQADKAKTAVLDVTAEALKKLKQMRAQEGVALAEDFAEHNGAIKKELDAVKKQAATVVEKYYEKLKKRIGELLAAGQLKLDEDMLAREVAIYADRCDISEEVTRLESHLDQFTETCNQNSQAGRKLDFITQEMLREANTIASKSANTDVARCIVEIKCQIDRLKEQVQNVE